MQETGKMDICSRLLKIEWQASSQADLLTETDPVRLRNVSELGGSGLDGGLASAKTDLRKDLPDRVSPSE